MDRYLYRRGFQSSAAQKFVISPRMSLPILRTAAFIFFLSLFVYGLVERPLLLTPELKVGYEFIPWLSISTCCSSMGCMSINPMERFGSVG